MIRMIAVDLDGTLLDEKGRLPRENVEALEQAARLGTKIVVSTGRFWATCGSIVEKIGCVDYLSSCNGAVLYARGNNGWTLVHKTPVPWEESLDLVRFLEQEGLFYRCYIDGELYYSAQAKQHLKEYEMFLEYFEGSGAAFFYKEDLAAFLEQEKKGVDKFFIMTKEGITREYLWENLPCREKLSITSSAQNNVEVTQKGIDKAFGLRWICREMEIGPEEVMAFGDSRNDLPMLQWAGCCFAMENAEPEVKAVCRYQAASNREMGVAKAVRQWVLGER